MISLIKGLSGIDPRAGTISVAADFPTTGKVLTAKSQYLILASVTDNDATKTNTGESFLADDYIVWNGTGWARVGNVSAASSFRGEYDASVNTFPATGGSGSGGAIVSGDFWVISVAGTLGGEAVAIGTLLFAKTDTPGQTASNWVTVNQDFAIGAASSTDNAIARFDSTTGKLLQNSGVIINDSDNLDAATFSASGTTPSITTASGKTNTGFFQVNGKTSGALKLTAADAAAQTVTVNLAAQTVGAATLTIPDMANVNKTVAWLESPSFTTPALGTPSSGILSNCTSATSTARGVTLLPVQIIISRNGSDSNNDIDFAAGNFQFSDNSGIAALSAITKRTDATWASGTGNGGMASGQSKPTSGTIHCFALSNAAGTLVDAGFDTSVSATNLIADSAVTTYFGGTPKFKRVGSFRTDGSQNNRFFIQAGNNFYCTSTQDVATGTAPGATTRQTVTLASIPTGIEMFTICQFFHSYVGGGVSSYALWTSLDQTDSTPSSALFQTDASSASNNEGFYSAPIKTNTSAQIGARFDSTDARYAVCTSGWIDYQL